MAVSMRLLWSWPGRWGLSWRMVEARVVQVFKLGASIRCTRDGGQSIPRRTQRQSLPQVHRTRPTHSRSHCHPSCLSHSRERAYYKIVNAGHLTEQPWVLGDLGKAEIVFSKNCGKL